MLGSYMSGVVLISMLGSGRNVSPGQIDLGGFCLPLGIEKGSLGEWWEVAMNLLHFTGAWTGWP